LVFPSLQVLRELSNTTVQELVARAVTVLPRCDPPRNGSLSVGHHPKAAGPISTIRAECRFVNERRFMGLGWDWLND